jgi:acyl-CoA synthetase (NDP forming)
MSMLADYARARQRAASRVDDRNIRRLADAPAGDGALDEHASKQLLRAYGVPVSEDRVFPPAPVAAADAARLPFPVVLKIVSRDIAHKSDVGGVCLDIADARALAAASRDMLARVRERAPQARLEGFVVAPMIKGGLETIVGIVNDAVFGPVVALGLGGIYAEMLKDVTYRLAPFGVDTAREMIEELKAYPLFQGARGQPPRDVEALAQALAAVSRMAWELRDRIAELDVNPLLVMPKGGGVVAVDALAVLRDGE